MKLFSVALPLAFAGLSIAQFSGLPGCAQGCADSFLAGGIGNCGRDPKCICGDASFIGEISCCLVGACEPADQTSAVVFAHQLCTAYGISVPDQPSCSTAVASPTGGGGGGGSSSSTAPASNSASPTAGSAAPTGSGTAGGTAAASSSSGTSSKNFAPRQTAGPIMVGALGGIAAAVALL